MPKKTVVAILFLACAAAPASAPMFAQATQNTPSASDKAALEQEVQMMRQDVRAHRKEITAANMTLTPDEATKFWPIYDQYIQETIKVNDTRWNLMKDYADNYDKMSDQLAQDYMKRSAAIDQQLTALREKYVPLFEKIISPKKTALWYQIDRRLDLVINLQLAALIPVVDASK